MPLFKTNIIMQIYKPFFMIDDSDKDGKAETIMDYVFSWCFRCTCFEYVRDQQPKLYHYCKYMLCMLLSKENEIDNIQFENVKVWKQEKSIDLWVETELYVNNKIEHHAILIENKYYTDIHDNQLKRYKDTFDNYYKDNADYPQTNLHYAVITCQYEKTDVYKSIKQQCKECDERFKIFHLYDLVDNSTKYSPSESDIFNEFFIREWL